METNEKERLELRSEKMRRLVGCIPNTIYWASVSSILFSLFVLVGLLIIFGNTFFDY